jgi:hypothetical protein
MGFDMGGRALKDAPTTVETYKAGYAGSSGPATTTTKKTDQSRLETRLFSPRGALPAPSTPPNQPRMPFSTPTSRKVAVGEAQRGFPRAGGRGVGAGKKEFEDVPPLECSPPARQRRAAGEVDGSEESLLSEGASAEAAWPWSKTADGGRARRRDDQSALSGSVAGGTGS